MELTFNSTLKRFEFRLKDRDERDAQGRLGVVLASSARLHTAWEPAPGRRGPATPVFWTADPYKAQALAAHASEELKQQIKDAVAKGGGNVPVLTVVNGVYIWSGPIESNGILYKDIPKRALFALCRTPWMSPPQGLPRDAGLGFDSTVWWTEQTAKAVHCAEYADEAARLAIGSYMAKRHAALEASRAEDSDIEIPQPDNGMAPFGFQRAGVAYAKPRKRVLFAHEMGLGKSVMAALWINLCPDVKRVLVICPASLKRWWMTVMETWLVRPATIGIADSKYTQVVPDTDIIIINYEMLAKRTDTGQKKMKDGKIKPVYAHQLRDSLRIKWDMIIVDECHRVKGDIRTVIRSRMVFSIQAERMAFLSGTPMVNRPRELWNLVHHLAPKQFPNKAEFMERYCRGGGNYMDPYAGASNLPELQERMRLACMVRVLKRDVLKDLPPILRQVIELPADGCESVVKNEILAFNRKEDVLSTMRLRVELAKASEHPEDYRSAVAELTKGIQVAFEELSRIRRETAIAKIPVVTEHVGSILSEGHKVLLFCYHKEVVRKIAEAFPYETVTLTGDTKLTDRHAAVERFQKDDKIRLFIGTIGAAGVGLTLTASSYVVFAELDWVPGNVTQAESRAHRIGTKDSVLVQHLVLEGSLDKRMADVLVEKQDIADRALDRESVDELLAEPVVPDREKMATQGVTTKDIARLAEKLTIDDVAAIHIGLRMLAGIHKHSRILEGATFRTIDAPLGKILAEKKVLTPRLAALGKKFLSRPEYKQRLAVVPEINQLFTREGK